jgi:hypothetical protein
MLKIVPMEDPFQRGTAFGERVGAVPFDDAKTSSNATSSAGGLTPATGRGLKITKARCSQPAQAGAP